MTAEFEIEALRFIALNGGPVFTFNPSISFMVNCPTVTDVESLWKKLIDGGKALMELQPYPFSPLYGWVQDKYGVSWQLLCSDKVTERSIAPALLFVQKKCGLAGEAIDFYASIFPDSKIGEKAPYPAEMSPTPGALMYADFVLAGQKFVAMDGPGTHQFDFNEAISLLVTCDDQKEIDELWQKMSAVPESEQCGWIKDKYGVSWQIAPSGMSDMLNGDQEKATRAMNAVMQMKKLDIAAIWKAYEGQ